MQKSNSVIPAAILSGNPVLTVLGDDKQFFKSLRRVRIAPNTKEVLKDWSRC